MLKQLNAREKMIISGGLITLAIIGAVFGGVLPLMASLERSAQQVASLERELKEMLAHRQEYNQLQAENLRMAAILKKRPADFSLFSYLDQLAGNTGIKAKIISMKPSTIKDAENKNSRSRVEIKIDEVTLEQVGRFIYRIETSPHLISVPRLSIKQKEKESGYLETILQVETLEK